MGTVGGALMYTRTVVQQHHSTLLPLTGFSGQQLLPPLSFNPVVTVEKSGLRLTEHTLLRLPRRKCAQKTGLVQFSFPGPTMGGRLKPPN